MSFFHRNPVAQNPIDPLEEVRRCLQSALEGSDIQGDRVVLPKEEFSIEPGISETREGFAALYFFVTHPELEEPFFDTSAGVGKTTSEAIQSAVASFLFADFCGARHLVKKEFSRSFETEFLGAKRRWQVCESCTASLGEHGEKRAEGYWEMLSSALGGHLGAKKHYWIKVYASKLKGGGITCECRVNNFVSKELTALLEAYAHTWKVEGDIASDKQFFFLSQDEETYLPLVHSHAEISDYTAQAIRLLADCDSDEKSDRLPEELFAITGDANLAVELQSFLPEICAENAFSKATYGETVTVCYTGGKKLTVGKDQFAYYRWMEDRALSGFGGGEFSQEDFQALIGMSAIYGALSKMLDAGGKIEDAVLKTVSIMVPEHYRVR